MAVLHDGPAASLSLGPETRHGDSRQTLTLRSNRYRGMSPIPAPGSWLLFAADREITRRGRSRAVWSAALR